MRAVVVERHGGPEVLTLREVEDPRPAPDEVLVEVRACSVNHLDVWARRGLPGVKLPLPLIPGNDVAGVVRESGALVDWLGPGDEVVVAPGTSCGHCEACLAGDDNRCRRYRMLGYLRNGGYAEKVAVPGRNCLPKPAKLDWPGCASLPLVFLTAWHMLVTKARVRPGEDVVVLAAGSGVGIAAVQIAKLFGARVIATASTPAKLERARELGADETILYAEGDWAAEVRRLTAKRGADIVFEHVGESTWESSILAVAAGGRIVTCGATSGPAGRTDLRHLFARQIQILGSYVGRLSELFEIFRWVERGQLRPVVHRALPLAEAAEAHRLLEKREVFGKVVLVP
jgi:NADPH:quinone reductase-like Zn-dependent oxidoreductase